MADSQERQQRAQSAQINRALGVFLLFFAGIVLFAVPFTQTGVGKVVNLVAASIIGLVGGAMVWWSRGQGRRP